MMRFQTVKTENILANLLTFICGHEASKKSDSAGTQCQ